MTDIAEEAMASNWREGQSRGDVANFDAEIGANLPTDQLEDPYAIALAKCVHLIGLGEQIVEMRRELERQGCASPEPADLSAAEENVMGHLLQLLQAMAWRLSPLFAPLIEVDKVGNDTARLAACCAIALRPLLPQCQSGRDIVFVPMPADVAKKLLDGLLALADGEVPSIFTPAKTGKHGNAFTWRKARHRAIEHVAFLHGTGVTKEIARKRVVNSIGGSTETLRDWERDFGGDTDEGYQCAYRMGQLSVGLSDSIPSEGLPADDQYLLDQLTAEPLETFGKRYKECFGTRHWGGGK